MAVDSFKALLGVKFDEGSIEKAMDEVQKYVDKQQTEINVVSNIEEFKRRLNSLNNAKITLNKIDTNGLSKNLMKDFNLVKKQIDNLFGIWDIDIFEKGLINDEDIADLNSAINSVQVLRSEIEKIHTKNLGLDNIFTNQKDKFDADIGKFIAKNQKYIEQMKIDFTQLRENVKNTFEPNDLKIYQKEFEKLKAQVGEYKALSGNGGKDVSGESFIASSNDINKKIVALQKQKETMGKFDPYFMSKDDESADKTINAIREIDTVINKLQQGEGIISHSDLIEADELLQKVGQISKDVKDSQTKYFKNNYFKTDRQKSVASVDRYMKENSKAMVHYASELAKLKIAMDKATDPTELRILNREFLVLKKTIAAAGQGGRTFGDELVNDIKKFGTWMTSSTIFMQTVNGFRQMITNVRDIDEAMVSLLKVTDETNQRYSQFLKSASESAMQLSANISDVINATADFSRLGYGLDDAETLGRVATIYKNIGDGLDIGDATKSIISTMTAFKKTANEAMDIVDIFNNIGNKFAIDSKGIGEGLQKAASALASSNNSLEESVALLTAGNTVVQDSSVMGTALKTVSLRITKTKSELEEMGEATDFALSNASKYADLINGLTKNQVNIVGDNGDYKNTYQILKEISQVWDDMDNMSKNSLLNSLFGVRQANVGAAILDNFEIAERVLQEAQNSSGSAMEEQEKMLQSINAKLNQTVAIFQSISNNVFNSDIFKLAIDSLNTILKLIETITDKLGSWGVLLGTAGAVIGAKGGIPLGKEFNWGTLLKDNQLKDVQLMTQMYQEMMSGVEGSTTKFNEALANSTPAMRDYFNNLNGGVANVNNLSKSLALATIKQKALNLATSMFVGIAIGVAIKATMELIDRLIVTQEELEGIAKESANSHKQAQDEVSKVNTELEKNRDRIKEIKSQGTLTYAEKSELDNLDKVNKKLEKQLEILKEQEAIKGYQAALDGGKALGKYIADEKQTSIYKNNLGNYVALPEDKISESNLSGQIAIIEHYNKVLDNTKENTRDWEEANDKVAKATQNLKEGQAELNQYLITYSSQYENIKSKSTDALTSQEKAIKSMYEEYQRMLDYSEQATDPNKYRAGEIDSIFNTKGIEATKNSLIELARSGNLDDIDFKELKNLNKAIEESGLEADESGSKINAFKEELKALASEGNVEINAFDLTNMGDSTKIFDERKEQLNDMIELVDAMGESYSLTADEARKFAHMFPELLAQGKVTADGLIKFNQDYVDNFVETKEAERKVDAQVKIEQLEAAKKVLIGQKEKAEAELALAQGVANGELTLEQAKTEMLASAEKQLVQYLMDLGVDEQTATLAAVEAKAGNMVKYNELVGKVSNDVATNLANSMVTAANSSEQNTIAMVNNLDALGRQSAKVAKQIASVSSGKSTYDGKVDVSGGGVVVENIGAKVTTPEFKAVQSGKITTKDFVLNNWQKDIKLDIAEYTKAIDSIDAQINLLKAQGNQTLDKYRKKAKKGKKGKKDSEFSEIFDWLEVAITRLEEQIKKLDNISSNVYKSWKARNDALRGSIEKTTEEITLQSAAYNVYMAKAKSVDLSNHYKELVREGALSIETITDKKLAKKIKEYQEYYNNAVETGFKIQELDKKLSSMYEDQFDQVISYWEARTDVIEKSIGDIEKMIDINEAKGLFSGKSYYESMMNLEKNNIDMLKKEREDLIKALDESVKSGAIVEYSESWYNLTSQINDVNSALLDANASLLDFSNELRQLNWDIFDYGQDRINSLSDETEFVLELLEKEKAFDRNGKNTQYANARYEMLGIRYNTYMQQADKYKNALRELDDQFKNDSLNKDYIERREELLDLQRESILNAESEKEAIIDLIEEGYNAQLDALQKIIDKRKEQLSVEEDLYHYQKEIAEKTKNIAQIEKQLNAYSTDSSEENQQTLQDLKNQLRESKEDLRETEYQKYLSDQEALLDTLYTSFEEWISVRLDDVDGLINETIDSINQNSTSISDTINGVASDVGYELNQPLKDIVDANNNNHNTMYDLVAKYDSNFSNKMTAVKTSIDNIYISVAQLVKKSEEEAKKKLEEQRKQQQQNVTSQSRPSSGSGSNNKPSSSSSSGSPSGGSSSSGSGGKDGSFFIFKKFRGNKRGLNINTSIVDRLKYNDFDSSFSRRSAYYKAMGGSGRYTGSSRNNTFMLSWMKKHGFNESGSLKSMMNTVNEDGLFLGRKDDIVIAKQDWETIGRVIDKAKGVNNANLDNSMGDVYIQMDLSGVRNYEEFVSRLEKDNKFIKYLKTSINSSLTNGNSLKKNRFR